MKNGKRNEHHVFFLSYTIKQQERFAYLFRTFNHRRKQVYSKLKTITKKANIGQETTRGRKQYKEIDQRLHKTYMP